MEPLSVWAKFGEYGLIGIIVGVILLMLWKMLMWVMAFIKDQEEKYAKERMSWVQALNSHNDVLTRIKDSIDRHDERADERGRHVREEHEKFLENQQVIIKAGDKTCQCLEEVREGLGRINGYKH